MHWRLMDIPVFEKRTGEIDASVFNTIKLSRIRLKENLRFEAEGLRTLDLILDKDTWIVVDRAIHEIPVMAWTEFQDKGRDNLHLPIKCTKLYYHAHAPIIEKRVLECAVKRINELLHPEK